MNKKYCKSAVGLKWVLFMPLRTGLRKIHINANKIFSIFFSTVLDFVENSMRNMKQYQLKTSHFFNIKVVLIVDFFSKEMRDMFLLGKKTQHFNIQKQKSAIEQK